MDDAFNAAKMREVASQSEYYKTKIQIAASKGKFEKRFSGGRSLLNLLRSTLEPLGFAVAFRSTPVEILSMSSYNGKKKGRRKNKNRELVF